MTNLARALISASLMGLGATLTFDLGALVLKQAFRLAPSNLCLVGRWLRYMPAGVFAHANIAAAPPVGPMQKTCGSRRSSRGAQRRQRLCLRPPPPPPGPNVPES
jgi:hypothetical protein